VSYRTLCPAAILAAVLGFVLLERVFPYDRGQRLLRSGFWTDLLFYTLIQGYVLGLVIGRLIEWLDTASGLSRLHLVSAWPIGVQVAFFSVSHDLYIYLFHRLQHRSPRLWRLHEAHHSVDSVDWIAASRSHALEILINQSVEFAPMILLGAAPQVPLVKGTIGAIWGMYIHANLGVRTGRLQWIFNGPEAHRWHHALDKDAHDKNFATKLALWDRLFGTAFLPADRKPAGYGLRGVRFPTGYLAQQAFAFRKRPGPAADPASREADPRAAASPAG
jgi:sterol desaturase/sphingolipid hydroxylase (fatty acid hydroxylase superfamily)